MNNLFFKKIIFVLMLCLTTYILQVKLVSAQSISSSLSPSQTELVIKPGRTADLKYTLNNKNDPAIYKIYVEPIKASKTSTIYFELLNPDLSLNEPIFIKNNSTVILNLRVLAPEDSRPQDYYFNLIAESQPPPIEEGSVNIRAKITLKSPLLITVSPDGELEIEPKISLFEIIPKRKFELFGFSLNLFDSYKKIPVVLIIENKGNNLLKPRGELIVRGPLWQSISYPIERQTILANSQKRLNLELPGRFLGNYKISANLNFGQGSPTVFASSSYIIIPFKFSAFMIGLSLFILFILSRLKRKHIDS